MKKYLKCDNCGKLNEVKSEYLVMCSHCNNKLNNSFKEWQKRNPNKSFEDYLNGVCLSEDAFNSQYIESDKKKKDNGYLIGLLAASFIIIFFLLIFFVKKKPEKGIDLVQTENRAWVTQKYDGDVTISTPALMNKQPSVLAKLPDEVREMIKNMETYVYQTRTYSFTYSFCQYVDAIEEVNLEGAAASNLLEFKSQAGIFDFKTNKIYTVTNGVPGIINEGTYAMQGVEYEYAARFYAIEKKLYQMVMINRKGDSEAREVIRKITDSINFGLKENDYEDGEFQVLE